MRKFTDIKIKDLHVIKWFDYLNFKRQSSLQDYVSQVHVNKAISTFMLGKSVAN